MVADDGRDTPWLVRERAIREAQAATAAHVALQRQRDAEHQRELARQAAARAAAERERIDDATRGWAERRREQVVQAATRRVPQAPWGKSASAGAGGAAGRTASTSAAELAAELAAEDMAAKDTAAAEMAAEPAAEDRAAEDTAAAEPKLDWKEKDEKAVLREMRERDEQQIAHQAEEKAAENEAIQAALTVSAERRAVKAGAQEEGNAEEARQNRAIVAAEQRGQVWASQAGAHHGAHTSPTPLHALHALHGALQRPKEPGPTWIGIAYSDHWA
eukprot:jgi/Chrpa1/1348/Chrysochromulina_OHIO_Genome00016805-RA